MKPAYDSLFFSAGAQVRIFHSSPTADHPSITVVCGSHSTGWRALVVHVRAGRRHSDTDIPVPVGSNFSVA